MSTKIDFDSLTRTGQRIIIAKDLLKRLRLRQFTPLRGTYLSRVTKGKMLYDRHSNEQLQEVLKGQECKGCQIGGMFLCAIDRHNKLTVADVRHSLNNDTAMRQYLTQWFSRGQTAEMERAFEGWGRYRVWSERKESRRRMRLIAQNIIRNNGKFVGKQLLTD